MADIVIRDLDRNEELDRKAMDRLAGGLSVAGPGPWGGWGPWPGWGAVPSPGWGWGPWLGWGWGGPWGGWGPPGEGGGAAG